MGSAGFSGIDLDGRRVERDLRRRFGQQKARDPVDAAAEAVRERMSVDPGRVLAGRGPAVIVAVDFEAAVRLQ